MNFTPQYTITNKILNNIKDINKLVVELSNKRFPQPILYQLNLEAGYVSTHSSTSIEGNKLGLTDIKRILKNNPRNLETSEKEVINYNNALEFLNKGIKDRKIIFNNDLILKTHKLVTKNILFGNDCEKYRNTSVIINNPLVHEVAYLPPDYKDIKSLMGISLSSQFLNTNLHNLTSLSPAPCERSKSHSLHLV